MTAPSQADGTLGGGTPSATEVGLPQPRQAAFKAGAWYSQPQLAERLIAGGRATLAVVSLFAIHIDPSAPARYATLAYTLLAAYLVYALLLLPLVWKGYGQQKRFGLATHVVDLAAFTVFNYLTEGATSPFYVYFVFSLFCAALRWQVRGTMWTLAAVIFLFVGLSLAENFLANDPIIELNRFIIRTSHLAVVAVLLGYLSAFEQRMRFDLSKIVEWPSRASIGQDAETLNKECLRFATNVLRAPRGLLIWGEDEEPFRHVAYLTGESFEWSSVAPAIFEPLVADALAGIDFLSVDASAAPPVVQYEAADGTRRLTGGSLHPDLRVRYDIRRVLALRVQGRDFRGRLFLLDKPRLNADDLILGAIVARQISGSLSQLLFEQQREDATITRERLRVARDLHDGLLQSLAGIGLQLQAARQSLDRDPETAKRWVAEAQALMVDEQRSVRHLVDDLRLLQWSRAESPVDLHAALLALREKSADRWGLQVTVALSPALRHTNTGLTRHISSLVQEALSNAARHGAATQASVTVATEGERLHLSIADNGHGFPFRGRLDLAALAAIHAGPRSIRERITALHGELTVDSNSDGSQLEMRLPLGDDRPAAATSFA